MVIGNGLMANAFSVYKSNSNILIFASGVSNSLEENPLEFERELQLLKKSHKNHPNSRLVYFSTLSILDSEVTKRPYVQHKLAMESYIHKNIPKYLILRVANVVGSKGNTHTIVNFLINAVKNEVPITIWKYAERNIIDVNDVVFIVTELLKKGEQNKIINIATNYNIPVVEILETIEHYFNKKAKVKLLPLGNPLTIDVSYIASYLKEIEENKGKRLKYIKTLLKSYY